MGSGNQLPMGFSSRPCWQAEEIRQTFCEGIGDAIEEAADNLQFSRHLFGLPVAYDRDLEAIETELRTLVQRINGLVIALEQAGQPYPTRHREAGQGTVTHLPNSWLDGGSTHQAA